MISLHLARLLVFLNKNKVNIPNNILKHRGLINKITQPKWPLTSINLHYDAPILEEASLLKQTTDGIVRVLEQNRWNHQKFWTESLYGAEAGHLA